MNRLSHTCLVLSWTILYTVALHTVIADEPRHTTSLTRIQSLIRGLDDDSFQLREEAHRELIEIGEPAVGALRRAAKHQSAEVRFRAGMILRQIQGKELEGTWTVIASKGVGGDLATIKFTGSKFQFTYESGREFEGVYQFHSLNGKHSEIDLVVSGGGIAYIISHVAADTLEFCGNDNPAARPTEFSAKEGDGRYYFILKRSGN